jgi:hypothetical protein
MIVLCSAYHLPISSYASNHPIHPSMMSVVSGAGPATVISGSSGRAKEAAQVHEQLERVLSEVRRRMAFPNLLLLRRTKTELLRILPYPRRVITILWSADAIPSTDLRAQKQQTISSS